MRLGSRVRRGMRRGNFLANCRERGDDSKTKQDDESPGSVQELSKTAKTIEQP